mmetsp:Transcript_23358/g.27599  ORF Transcript_23358/g.27599 Transcript_23358/m.27599 type:complete len:129 (-) Transcript_23358:195-581(-)|eukprot:CAMPEP_0198266556 /NCGR_PEP_ID=MMETSP1447-20131203/28853_1 /TAXON_ID=420782 /ORGANISM="Chaetoceros dichaeta, Strain CCMP1751" /LENGTH=128 /DNA_ID=CAMNT_0043956691 /DNA_START=253 /DNA_END=639 /DNA_ORIENTATION=+
MEDFRDYNTASPPLLTNSHQSWANKLTSTILSYTHDSLLLNSIAEGLSDQDNGESGSGRALRMLSFVLVGVMTLLVVYGFGRILQMLVGKEIVMKREIVIVEEIRLKDLLLGGDGVGKSARDKKQKNQ